MPNAGGSAGRLGDWFREWQLPLRRFLARRRVGTSADIEDIAQEVFVRLIQYDRADLVDHPKAYLFKIAANVSAEWAVRSSRRLPHDSAWLTELVDALSPDTELEREDRDQRMRSALEALPARAREIVRLHFSEGMTHQEVAATLGVTRKMVKRDMARAYAELRILLDFDLADPAGCRRAGTDR